MRARTTKTAFHAHRKAAAPKNAASTLESRRICGSKASPASARANPSGKKIDLVPAGADEAVSAKFSDFNSRLCMTHHTDLRDKLCPWHCVRAFISFLLIAG